MSSTLAGPKIEVIQLLRFVAAAMVLATHTTFYIHERMSSEFSVWFGGESGVPIFFVISGIVIVLTSSRLSNDRGGAGIFMERRIARIVPLYWLVTTLKVVLALALPSVVLHNHFDAAHAMKSYFFIPAFNQAGEIRPIHGVGWTLLHEMYFYLLFAGAMIVRLRPIWTVTVFLLAAYAYGQFFEPTSAAAIVATSPINLHFVVGMWVGRVLLGTVPSMSIRILMPVVAGAAIAAVIVAGWKMQLDAPALLIAAALPLLCAFAFPRRLQVFARLGDSSYSLYLLHPLIAAGMVAVLAKLGVTSFLAVLFISMVSTIFVSHLIHVIVETRLIAVTKSIFHSIGKRTRPLQQAA